MRAAIPVICAVSLFGCGSVEESASTQSRTPPDVRASDLPPLRFETLADGRRRTSVPADILFASGRATITERGRRALREQLAPALRQQLKSKPGAKVLVVGYTDGVGSHEYNDDLSRRRADAAAAVLHNAGFPTSQLTARGRGEQGAVDGVADQSQRRVDVELAG